MSKSEIKNRGLVKNSNQPQQLPFDVQNNINLFENQFGYHHKETLFKWVKEQPNFKGIIPFHFTPIVENQKEYDLYKFELDDKSRFFEMGIENIPTQLVEIITDKDCKVTSVTMVISKNGKQYKVISNKDYGIIKSRYMVDSKGKFINYEKCDLVPFNGEYKEYRWNNQRYGDDKIELNKVFNYKNGIKHGECKTYYKGDYPYHRIGSYKDENNQYWYEMFSYVNGTKEGLYENTKFLERGNLKNGKRVGEWIVRISDDIWIPNFSKRYKKNIEEQETHRIKCFYMDYKLEGKWEGITMNEFFGIKDDDKIGKVGGEFKNGIMDGDFYSEFWNGKYIIYKGKYKNNVMYGEWYEKLGENVVPLKEYQSNKNGEVNKLLGEGKIWYDYKDRFQVGYDSCFSSDEIKNYTTEVSFFDGERYGRGIKLSSTKEFYENGELNGVFIENKEDTTYTIELDKGINPFHEYTKDWIPSPYKNKGFSVSEYSGKKDGKDDNERIQFRIKENNILGHNGFCDDTLLRYGYPYTHQGKCVYDRRKKDTYPTLPSIKDDLYEMGKYYSTDYQYGEDRFSLYSIDGELFKGEFRDFEPQNFESKCEEIIKRVVNLLKERREKELEEIKKKESEEFNLFPMD